jgi:hypothetical protein
LSNSANLQLPFLDANQNQKHVTHNAALLILDTLVNCNVVSNALTMPPTSRSDGQCWSVAVGGTGAWAGKDNNIAAWQDGAWTFYAPKTGFSAFADNLATLLVWTGSAWATAVPPSGAANTFVQALIFG